MAGGASAAVALPLLEAMLDQHGEALADGNALPVRFMSWFWGNGIIPSRWTPTGQGATYTLSQELLPLANVKDYVTVLTGFDSQVAPFTKITHHEGMSIFSGYNNRDIGQGPGFFSNAGGRTIDQLVADVPGVGDCTPFSSLQLGVSKKLSTADYGTTMHNMSHRDYLQPLPPDHDPKNVWTRLFDMFDASDPNVPHRRSVLDLVRGQVAKLKNRLGAADIARLDAHLEGLDELQKKIDAAPPVCMIPTQPTVDNVEVGGTEPIRAVADAMDELIVKAFECDQTRVVSYLFVEGAGEHLFRDLTDENYTTDHHTLTHDPNATNAIHNGVVYSIERLAHLLDLLRNTPDGPMGTNLLDNTIVFAASDCSEGWTHSVDNQPMLVCGGGRGTLVHPGIHYASSTGQNPTDVLLALLQLYDTGATSVGADQPMSTTPFNLIKA